MPRAVHRRRAWRTTSARADMRVACKPIFLRLDGYHSARPRGGGAGEEQGRDRARRGKLVGCARVPYAQVAQVRAAGCIPHAGASSDLVAAY